ncbi:uncharacterized protein LOC125028065 isoform X2 [Penaeus chinensis]|uniref:uncharacterized protein LOC125028065 isoform X2 n=1 Tax=Penaeus chinensis TaxID=139456 RepID=UPI001FB8005F|nr:uncharacterized protein LOC125028065 isoform X2 [Penaeus chinensis]
MDEDTNSTSYNQDGSFDEISIKEENNMDDFSVFVNEEENQECTEKEKEEFDPLGEFQCQQEEDDSNQDLTLLQEKILKPNNHQPQKLAYNLAPQQRACGHQHPF